MPRKVNIPNSKSKKTLGKKGSKSQIAKKPISKKGKRLSNGPRVPKGSAASSPKKSN